MRSSADPAAPPARVAARWSNRWWPRAAAAVAGAVPAYAFPEAGVWPLAVIGLLPLLVLVAAAGSRREGAVRGWLGGAGFLAATHSWLWPVTGPFLVLVVLALGALWLPFGVLTQAALHRCATRTPTRVAFAVAVVPSSWLVAEYARSWERLGGPFGLLGASQHTGPLQPLTALGGVWATSAGVVAVATALALVLIADNRRARVTAGALAVLVTGVGPAYQALSHSDQPAVRSVRVAVVQPGPTDGRDSRLAAGLAATRSLIGRDVDLVIWAESSVGFDLDQRSQVRAELTAAAAEVGADLLVGTDARRAGAAAGIVKSTVLVTAAGLGGRYDKQRLVPFGEYVPLRPALGWLAEFTPAAGEDRRRGDQLAILATAGLRVGPLVCFESAFPDMTRQLARAGVDLVVVQSSTSTFQHSAAPEQHAALAEVRAVESGLPVVHATLTGASAVYAGDGSRLGALSTEDRGTLVVDVPLRPSSSPYVAVGDVVPRAAVVIAVVTLVALLTVPRRRPAGSDSPAGALRVSSRPGEG